MKTILFICTGNVCRSPMAEALFRHAVKGRGDFRVVSAGIGAMDGQPPTSHSVRAMRELGIDISGQRSRMLTAELVRSAHLILGMTHSHVDTVALLYPPAAEKPFCCGNLTKRWSRTKRTSAIRSAVRSEFKWIAATKSNKGSPHF